MNDKIYNAIKIYNNGYYSEKMRDEAFDLLLELFSDQLNQDREIYEAEKWISDSDIELMRWSSREIERETQHLIDILSPIWF